MKLKKQTIAAICVTLFAAYSCSRQATVPTLLTYTPAPDLSNLDSLLTPPEINLTFYKPEPVQFFVPSLEISESFSTRDKSNVRATDDLLFAKRQELIIDLNQIEENAFSFPLPGARVLSPFGKRHSRQHTGVDLKISRYDTIVSAFDGIIRMAGGSRGYGNVIVIRHYNGLETVYAHNSKHLVKSGDRVKAGTPIAITGRTGRASTEHCHFEVRVNGQPFDPTIFIDFEHQELLHKCLVFISSEKGIQLSSI